MKRSVIIVTALLMATTLKAQTDSIRSNVPTGWKFGVLPCLGYDADQGFQIGAITNTYYFGDGSTYPGYLHSIYAQAAYSTRGSGMFRLSYDSKYLIKGHRLSIDLTYLPESVCNFYGFNGYQNIYNPNFVEMDSYEYISRTYYKIRRNILRFSADLQGNIAGNLYWNGGLGLLYYNVSAVNIDGLNKFIKDDDKKLPDTASLYDKYVDWGLIKEEEKNGGIHPYLHGGLTFDTRDRQQNPNRGIHTDIFLTYNAAFGEMKDYNNLKFNFNWRHYVPVWGNKIIFAYQMGTQLTLAGESPFYMNGYMNQLYYQRVIYEGLGGASSIRGVIRNRILADGFAFANVEFRFLLAQFQTKKNNFYVGLNPFMDGGIVLQPYDMNSVEGNDEIVNDIDLEEPIYRPHLGVGCGLKLAMNDNFVISLDWAMALDDRDNNKIGNMYMKLGYMF